MSKSFFNSLPNFNSTTVNVDRENGILKNTCIAQFGENKNDSFFDDSFLLDLVKQGNETDKGIKSRFGHPNMCSTSFGSYIGRYKNFTIQNKNVYADLHLDEITKKTQVEGKGISMFEYIVSMAETNPDMFGNSIVIYSELYEEKIDEKNKVLHKLSKFKACDLVDDPAATDALFSDNKDLGILVTQFLDTNPQIFSSIEKQPAILTDFFERYVNYQNRKSKINFNMNIFEKMKAKLAGKKDDAFDVNLTLADGTIITVVTDANKPQVGDAVTDETGAPLADGSHVLPDGGTIVVAAGVITEITAAAEADDNTEPTIQEVMQSVGTMQKSLDAVLKQFNANQKTTEKTFELFADKLNVLGKNIKSEYQAPPGEEGNLKNFKTGYDADAVAQAREKLTNKNK
jgi:hypothetical protein